MTDLIEAWYNYPKGKNLDGILVDVHRDSKGRFIKVKLVSRGKV